jgi:hypothetical protein
VIGKIAAFLMSDIIIDAWVLFAQVKNETHCSHPAPKALHSRTRANRSLS